ERRPLRRQLLREVDVVEVTVLAAPQPQDAGAHGRPLPRATGSDEPGGLTAPTPVPPPPPSASPPSAAPPRPTASTAPHSSAPSLFIAEGADMIAGRLREDRIAALRQGVVFGLDGGCSTVLSDGDSVEHFH